MKMNNNTKERLNLRALFNLPKEPMDEIQFTIKFFGDEARVFESKCLSRHFCACNQGNNETQCGYSAAEIKEKLQKYYQDRADYIAKQSIEEFLHDQGIYF